jgi:hypothetical protein
MTIGFDGIGFHAIGEMITGSPAPLIYPPVSRLASGAYSAGVKLVVLGVDLEWDNGDPIIWDDDSDMGWEA